MKSVYTSRPVCDGECVNAFTMLALGINNDSRQSGLAYLIGCFHQLVSLLREWLFVMDI